MTKSD